MKISISGQEPNRQYNISNEIERANSILAPNVILSQNNSYIEPAAKVDDKLLRALDRIAKAMPKEKKGLSQEYIKEKLIEIGLTEEQQKIALEFDSNTPETMFNSLLKTNITYNQLTAVKELYDVKDDIIHNLKIPNNSVKDTLDFFYIRQKLISEKDYGNDLQGKTDDLIDLSNDFELFLRDTLAKHGLDNSQNEWDLARMIATFTFAGSSNEGFDFAESYSNVLDSYNQALQKAENYYNFNDNSWDYSYKLLNVFNN